MSSVCFICIYYQHGANKLDTLSIDMILPDSIDILGTQVKIVLTTERPDVWGEWDSETDTILINSNASQEKQCVILMHEILHCIDDHLGLNLKHHSVYAVSQVLFAMLKENAELKEWIFSHIR